MTFFRKLNNALYIDVFKQVSCPSSDKLFAAKRLIVGIG